MFETHETTDETSDGMEKRLWQGYVLAFAVGCFVTFLIFYWFVLPSARRAAADSAEKATQQKFLADLAKNPLGAQLASTQASLHATTRERDQCKVRFDRQTILYDNTIPIDPGKVWIIPADIEPIAAGHHHISYTHYDPKTKTETAHFYPKGR
jgi:hypothetical protein